MFTITQFRDGYDLEQVDVFLDQIAEDLEARDAEKKQLEDQIADLTQQLEEARSHQEPESATESSDDAEQSAQAAALNQGYADGDAQKSSAMLQLALELHDKYVHEGESKRDQIVQDGEQTAKRLVEEAQAERADVLRTLGNERTDLSTKIEQLREFEGEYRNTLRSYIQSQLRGLDGSPEPAGAPELSN